MAPPTPAPVTLLWNPTAGGGRSAAAATRVERALRAAGLAVVRAETRTAGDEARLAREAAEAGARVIAVVGGDGTLHHTVRGLLGASAMPALALFGAGTGNDFAKSVGLQGIRSDAALAAYAARVARAAAGDAGTVRSLDVGRLTVDARTVPIVNAAGVGFDAHVLARTLGARWLRGSALYVVTALGALFRYRGLRAAVATDGARLHAAVGADATVGAAGGRSTPDDHWLTVVVANGAWFGGTFRIAPDARVDDGRLDVIAIADASPWQRARLFGAAPRGGHVCDPRVRATAATTVTIEGAPPLPLQVDGEWYGDGKADAGPERDGTSATSRRITIDILPAAVRLVTPG